jgi:hypothetical protein
VDELHLLDGELFIDGRKLVPGDYNYAKAGRSNGGERNYNWALAPGAGRAR